MARLHSTSWNPSALFGRLSLKLPEAFADFALSFSRSSQGPNRGSFHHVAIYVFAFGRPDSCDTFGGGFHPLSPFNAPPLVQTIGLAT